MAARSSGIEPGGNPLINCPPTTAATPHNTGAAVTTCHPVPERGESGPGGPCLAHAPDDVRPPPARAGLRKQRSPADQAGRAFTLSELISSLSYALDLTEGQAIGHSARSCVIGMRIASAIGLGADERLALFYALLLKDAGCSSNSARLAELFGNDDRALKRDVKNSEGVAAIAVQLAEGLGMPAAERRELRRAALLHDIGKLGVSNAILDKPGKLDDAEWAAMRRHPAYTFEILDRVKRFQPLAEMAASHHERMDGNGYHRELTAERLSRPARILAVADVTEALLADRPYRKGLGWDRVLSIVGEMAGPVLCPECCEVLKDGDPPSAARD